MTEKVFFTSGADWFQSRGWTPFPFQKNAWRLLKEGHEGLINAPTGSGKTYSLAIPLIEEIAVNPVKDQLYAIWITPIRALAAEIKQSTEKAIKALNADVRVEIRTGDTSATQKKHILNHPPHILITTPESLHLFLTYKHYRDYFGKLRWLVADEWHELLGSKRGVQVDLALSRLRTIAPQLRTWGISATIGNMSEGMEVLLGHPNGTLVRSELKKETIIRSILPDTIDSLPWAGHLGINLLPKILPLLKNSRSTLLFTNTRGQCELWYQKILEAAPEFAGEIAMHHSAISSELRNWVENALHEEKLRIVVCTSSLDLGVDFRPVETIIQVGGPKGVARFMQRAGRSGHRPGAISTIWFVPTHSLELIEASALRAAITENVVENRYPFKRSFDVLAQYLITLACSDGFRESEIWEEVQKTHAFRDMTKEEWGQVLDFITHGGDALDAYDEYRKVIHENGVFRIYDKRTALRHRMSIGTIVGENAVSIVFRNGKKIGTVEEWFIARLNPGDTFWFAGRSLRLVSFIGTEAVAEPANRKSGKVPSWQGGRMPLSSELSQLLRNKVDEFHKGEYVDEEMAFLSPLLEVQSDMSRIPSRDEFLIEYLRTSEGFHVYMYPFEGRAVHEGLAALVAHKISLIKPISFSIAMNDYGFELLSDQEIPIYEALEQDLFHFPDLKTSIEESVNAGELARRRFRDIAAISGLIFKGMPGRKVKERHLQTSVRLLFDVFADYQSDHILLQQAYDEVTELQLEERRMRETLERINKQKIVFTMPERPTPFCFPILVDGIRERFSSERLEDRINKFLAIG